jgi:hypothetical protein
LTGTTKFEDKLIDKEVFCRFLEKSVATKECVAKVQKKSITNRRSKCGEGGNYQQTLCMHGMELVVETSIPFNVCLGDCRIGNKIIRLYS